MKNLINRAKSIVSRIHSEEDGQAMEALLVTVLGVVILVFAYKMMTSGGESNGGLIGLIEGMATKLLGGISTKVGAMIGL